MTVIVMPVVIIALLATGSEKFRHALLTTDYAYFIIGVKFSCGTLVLLKLPFVPLLRPFLQRIQWIVCRPLVCGVEVRQLQLSA